MDNDEIGIDKKFKANQQKREEEQQTGEDNNQNQEQQPKYNDNYEEYFKQVIVDNPLYRKGHKEKQLRDWDDSKYVDMFDLNFNDNMTYGDKYDYRTKAFLDLLNITTNAIINSNKQGITDKDKVQLCNDIADFIRHYNKSDSKQHSKTMARLRSIANRINEMTEPVKIGNDTYNIANIFEANADNILSNIGKKTEILDHITGEEMISNAGIDFIRKKIVDEKTKKEFEETAWKFFEDNIDLTKSDLRTKMTEEQINAAKELATKIRKLDDTESNPDIKKFDKGIKEEFKDLFITPLVQLFSFLTCLLPFEETKQDLIKQGTKIGQDIINLPFKVKEKIVDSRNETGERYVKEAKEGSEYFRKSLEDKYKEEYPECKDYIDKVKKYYDYSKALKSPINMKINVLNERKKRFNEFFTKDMNTNEGKNIVGRAYQRIREKFGAEYDAEGAGPKDLISAYEDLSKARQKNDRQNIERLEKRIKAINTELFTNNDLIKGH